jgi:hypothetical protein
MPIPKAVGKDQHEVICREETSTESRWEVKKMLWTIAVILFVLWALGLVSAYTLGGYIHVLLIIALVMVLFNVLQGRRVV